MRQSCRPHALLCALLLACSCGGPPVPEPVGPNSSALAVHFKLRTPVTFFTHAPDIVLFARVEDGKDLCDVQQLYVSSLAKDGTAYLLNVEPGTYVAVVAAYKMSTPGGDPAHPTMDESKHCNYCSRELILETRTDVGPGEFAFLGDFEADAAVAGIGDPDACQKRIQQLVAGGSQPLLWQLLSADFQHWLSPHKRDRSETARRQFLEQAKNDLKKTKWTGVIDRTLSASTAGRE